MATTATAAATTTTAATPATTATAAATTATTATAATAATTTATTTATYSSNFVLHPKKTSPARNFSIRVKNQVGTKKVKTISRPIVEVEQARFFKP